MQTSGKEFPAHGPEPRLEVYGSQAVPFCESVQAAGDVENVLLSMVFLRRRKIAFRADRIVFIEQRCVLFAQEVDNVVVAPQIEFSFLPFAVGVFRRVELSVGAGHLPEDIIKGLLGNAAVKGIARDLVRGKIQRRKLGIVVEHLLEMRHKPAFIHRIAVKSAAQMVVEPPLGHFSQGHQSGIPNRAVFCRIILPKQQVDGAVRRKFWSRAESAMIRIERAQQLADSCRNELWRGRIGRAGTGLGVLAHVIGEFLRAFKDFTVPGQPRRADGFEHGLEAGAPHPGARRKVGARVEGLQRGREKHAHGPASATRHDLGGGHIDAVNIRPFLAIHLNRHIVPVQQFGDRVVLEGFPLHDVAPVAGGIPNREKDGFILVSGLFQRFITPGVPVDRVMGMLQKIGTGSVD